MKILLAPLVLVMAFASTEAQVVVHWSFPTAFPTGTGLVPQGTQYLPPSSAGAPAGRADLGSRVEGSQVRSVHASTQTTYTSPQGNGSQYSFSSNNWSPGDYYEISFATTGLVGTFGLSWNQARSSTGPDNFKVSISVNSGPFEDLGNYTVLQSGGGGAPGTWSSTTYNSLYTHSLSLGTAPANASSVFIRFINVETSVSPAAGSSRIDDIQVTYAAIPEPASYAALSALTLFGFGIWFRARG